MDRKKIYIAVATILSIISIAIIFALTFDESSLEHIKNMDVRWFILALLLHIFSWFLWGLRISMMSSQMGRNLKIDLKEGTSIALANLFLAAITPSMIGGEPVRIQLISKKGFGIGKGTAIVFGERVFDAIFVLMVIFIPFIVLSENIKNGAIKFGLIAGMIFILLGMLLFIYTILRPISVKKFIVSIFKKIKTKISEEKVENFFKKIDGFIESFHEGATCILRRENKTGIITIMILTAIYWFLEFMIPSCILMGLNQNPIIIQSISVQILLMIIAIIPLTPGSSGIAEGGAALLYSTVIPDKSLLGILILLWRFITYHVNIIVGGIFQYKFFKSFLD